MTNRLVIFITLSLITTVGLLKSLTVLGGDQSLFVVIAQLLDAGKILYKDLFDYKQPGIFMFYLVAGKMIGWSDIEIHLFELGYWLLFSVILIYSLKDYHFFRANYFHALLPLFIVGVYYCNATFFHLTQLEALINFPLFLIVWLLDRVYKTEQHVFITYLAIGFLIGIVILSKLVFAPIIFSFLVIHFIFTIKYKSFIHIIKKQLPPLIVGFMLPLSVFIGYIVHYQIEHLVVDIFFKIPASVIGLTDQIDPSRLYSSVSWFGKRMALLALLAAIGVLITPRKELHFFGMIISWGVVGLFVILMQKTSWWSYHFQLLYVPIGLFAALGLDFVIYHTLQAINFRTPAVTGFIVISFVAMAFNNQYAALKQGMLSTNYTKLDSFDYARDDAANIIPMIKPEDSIFICGNPRMYVLTSHLPELSTNGWILEYYLDFQWEDFYTEFRNKPPTYLFVKNDYDRLIESKSEKLWQVILTEYREIDTVENGKWYKKLSSL
ncbi:MAG: hypothetical protein IT524_06050 [Nitrosomonas sp.]|nr:hypothetical protein [Nitrosomonas sp.]